MIKEREPKDKKIQHHRQMGYILPAERKKIV
jgi:hypothetical protein